MTPPRARRHRAGRVPCPDNFLGPLFSTLFLLLAFGAVAHASGSGWVQVIGAVTAGLALVALFGPALAVSRLEVTCTQAARDATAGEPLVLELVSNRPLRCTPLSPRGKSEVLARAEPVLLTITPPHRGIMSSVKVRLATAAPLGLLWWSRDATVALPAPVAVAPDTSHGAVRSAEIHGDDHGRARPVMSQAGEIRGVRAYHHGDSRRRVHWRASAHTGTLMVRELEETPDVPVKIVADLSDDPDLADEQSADVLGTICDLLASGKPVILETVEQGRKISRSISGRLGAGRQLARAAHNPYAEDGPPSRATGAGRRSGAADE